jgi:hypothetical protein
MQMCHDMTKQLDQDSNEKLVDQYTKKHVKNWSHEPLTKERECY